MFLYEHWKNSVTLVKVPHGDQFAFGVGMVLSKDGMIGTVNHILNPNEDEVEVQLCNYPLCKAEVVLKAPEYDFAVLKIKQDFNLNPVSFKQGCIVGETVYTFYHSTPDLNFSLSQGIISGVKREITVDNIYFRNVIQVQTLGNGHSGSPIFDKNGRVLGMLFSTYKEIKGTVFGVPSEDLLKSISILKTMDDYLVRSY